MKNLQNITQKMINIINYWPIIWENHQFLTKDGENHQIVTKFQKNHHFLMKHRNVCTNKMVFHTLFIEFKNKIHSLTFTWINSSLNLQFMVSNSVSWLLEILNWFLNLATYNFKTKGYFREYHNIKHNVPFITLFILFKKSKICHKCNVLMWSKLFYEYNFPAQVWISVSRYICFICM